MAGSERIRASIEALPERRRTPWHTEPSSYVFAEPVNAWIAEATSPAEAEYIALMDPHVGQAVADLDEALTHLWKVIEEGGIDRGSRPLVALSKVDDAHRRFIAAIEGSEQR